METGMITSKSTPLLCNRCGDAGRDERRWAGIVTFPLFTACLLPFLIWAFIASVSAPSLLDLPLLDLLFCSPFDLRIYPTTVILNCNAAL